MSNMYAIKETTLTAIGDAIRNKQGFGSETFDTIELNGKNTRASVTATSSGTSYKYIVDVTVLVAGNFRNLYIQNNGATLSTHLIKTDENFTETVIVTNPQLDFNLAAGSNDEEVININVTSIPLDENGNEYKYTPLEMAEVIEEMPDVPLPLVLTSDQSYGCSGQMATNYINLFGDTISTKDVSNTKNMFANSKLEYIPFDIDIESSTTRDMSYMFYQCANLKELPKIIEANPSTTTYLFYGCYRLREIPEGYTDTWKFNSIHNNSYALMANMFYNCASLRNIPESFLKELYNKGTSSYYVVYMNMFYQCHNLDKITGLAVHPATITSNCFSNTFISCERLKSLTFEYQEDGTPKTANWKGQTIDLSGRIGHAYSTSTMLLYNSGITADKEVTDDATYQALKDDPDWFSCNQAYSRYNHDSAVETINSLPDTSAYLASAGGTNTIKFLGTAGSATDGGAINTLTEEEIAVATAKGWTVTFV